MNGCAQKSLLLFLLVSSCAVLSAQKKSSRHSSSQAAVIIPFGSREKNPSATQGKTVVKREVFPGVFSYEFSDGTRLSFEELTEFLRTSSSSIKSESCRNPVGEIAAECLFAVISVEFEDAKAKAERMGVLP